MLEHAARGSPRGAHTEFEQTLEATRAGRREHVGASADLRAVMAEISEQVKVLDGIVRYRFGDNAELMGALASAHRRVPCTFLHSATKKIHRTRQLVARQNDLGSFSRKRSS